MLLENQGRNTSVLPTTRQLTVNLGPRCVIDEMGRKIMHRPKRARIESR